MHLWLVGKYTKNPRKNKTKNTLHNALPHTHTLFPPILIFLIIKAEPAWTNNRHKQHLQFEEKEKDAWECKFTQPKPMHCVQTLHRCLLFSPPYFFFFPF